MRLSLLIPFYNEEEQIPVTLETVVPIMEGVTPDFEIIAVDDGSTDGTWRVLKAAADADPRLRIIRFSRNFGKEAAICAAMAAVDGDAAILMDGDLQHPPEYIPEMVRLWREGYDIVEGVKTDRGRESAFSRITANTFYKLFAESGGIDLKNASDFKLMDRRVVEVWNTLEEHNTFFRGLSAWLGFKRKDMPFEVAERQHGKTKWNVRGLIKLSANAITSFSSLPLKAILLMGGLFIIIALILAIQTLVRYLTGHALEGFTTVILLVLITGGLIMISLGLIGTYIARIYDEVKGRPRFIVAEDNKDRDHRRNRLRAEARYGGYFHGFDRLEARRPARAARRRSADAYGRADGDPDGRADDEAPNDGTERAHAADLDPMEGQVSFDDSWTSADRSFMRKDD